ncbi:MAG: 50S ribosomal protein L15 [Ignavibacteria bacterium]|nr:50S ribosomal protein L15 [Ignavibacteria bacterium]
MDILSNLKYAEGSIKNRKRIGRGTGSGHGGTATKGNNGQKQRSGHKFRAFFEGGQMPLQRRIPKRGFTNIFKVSYQSINLSKLQKLVDDKIVSDGIINPAVLYKSGLLSKAVMPYKILGDGNLTAKLNIETYAVSKTAKEKIEASGGTIKEINIK